MPLRISRRENKWCLIETDNSTIACHNTKREAISQLVAIETNKATKEIDNTIAQHKHGLNIFKAGDDLRFMGLVSSNSFRDREGEIVKSDGLKEYANGDTETKPGDNMLLVWHGGDPIGKIIHAQFYKSFLIEVAQELPDKEVNIALPGQEPVMTTIKNIWDNIESTPGQWRTSIGFRALGKSEQGIIYPIDKIETSIIYRDYQANTFTVGEVIS